MSKVLSSREEVAARAKVSPVTVSRCFTNPETVSPKRRAMILATAAELGYHPNRGASLMRSSATGRLVLIERRLKPGRDWDGNRLYDYLFKSTYHGVLSGLAESVYTMAYIQVHDDDQLKQALARMPMDGIIGMNFEYPDELAPIIDSDVPYVIAHHARDLDGFNRCYTDNYEGGRLAGDYLRRTGHRHVAYVTYNASQIRTHGDRLEGFREGLGLDRLSLVVDNGSRGKEGGVAAAWSIVEYLRTGQALDAVAVLNDETALHLAQVLMQQGVAVPRDVSLIGYDNNPVSSFMPFNLASVDLNLENVYHQAVTSLIRAIKTGESIHTGVAPILVEGDSVQPRGEPESPKT